MPPASSLTATASPPPLDPLQGRQGVQVLWSSIPEELTGRIVTSLTSHHERAIGLGLRIPLFYMRVGKRALSEVESALRDPTRSACIMLVDTPGRSSFHEQERTAVLKPPWPDEELHKALAWACDLGQRQRSTAPPQAPATSRVASPEEKTPRCGSILDGRYRIAERLGQGGFATVYKAHHEFLGIAVAIKVLDARSFDQQAQVDALIREARLVASIRHRNVVRVLDAALHDGWAYIAMDYVDGCTLAELISASGGMEEGSVVRIAGGIAAGLAAAHAKGILHCDVKPANVMMHDDQPLVVDFGIARTLHESPVWMLTGTPNYMAPEQAIAGEAIDCRCDIYALGCSMFHMLSGRPPYRAARPLELIHAHACAPVPSLCDSMPSLNRRLGKLIHRMMAKQAADRPRDCSAVISELAALTRPRPVQSTRQRPANRPRNASGMQSWWR